MAVVFPRRLDAIQSLVPQDAQCIADIGYDHGKLLTRLVEERPAVRTIGVDKSSHAAGSFMKRDAPNDPAALARIDLREGLGLQPLETGECDCAVFAGLGEVNIRDSLLASPEIVAGFHTMVFAPVYTAGILRKGLKEIGWRVNREKIAYENKLFYLIYTAVPGEETMGHPVMQYFAPRLFEEKDPGLFFYLKDLKELLAVKIRYTDRQPPGLREMCLNIDAALALSAEFAGEGYAP